MCVRAWLCMCSPLSLVILRAPEHMLAQRCATSRVGLTMLRWVEGWRVSGLSRVGDLSLSPTLFRMPHVGNLSLHSLCFAAAKWDQVRQTTTRSQEHDMCWLLPIAPKTRKLESRCLCLCPFGYIPCHHWMGQSTTHQNNTELFWGGYTHLVFYSESPDCLKSCSLIFKNCGGFHPWGLTGWFMARIARKSPHCKPLAKSSLPRFFVVVLFDIVVLKVLFWGWGASWCPWMVAVGALWSAHGPQH